MVVTILPMDVLFVNTQCGAQSSAQPRRSMRDGREGGDDPFVKIAGVEHADDHRSGDHARATPLSGVTPRHCQADAGSDAGHNATPPTDVMRIIPFVHG